MDPLKPAAYLLGALAFMAIAGAIYLKLAETRIEAVSNPKTVDASFGELVRVGDIDLTVLNVTRYSGVKSNFGSQPNFAIEIEAANTRGDRTQDFSPLSLKVVDDAGVVHESVACPQCPNQVGGGMPTSITKGGTLAASFYFQLPSQALPAQVLYKPLFASGQAKIDVRGTVARLPLSRRATAVFPRGGTCESHYGSPEKRYLIDSGEILAHAREDNRGACTNRALTNGRKVGSCGFQSAGFLVSPTRT